MIIKSTMLEIHSGLKEQGSRSLFQSKYEDGSMAGEQTGEIILPARSNS